MSNIKVTKRHHYDIESDDFDAVLTEDFYKHDLLRPFVMTVRHTGTREVISKDWFESKDDALDYFCEFFDSNNTTTH
jgi:hypothetical protein|tara:strand:+ start:169 stop:399 length:231 start_codon:yes stop_codon:yes gene_type:complete